MPDDFGVVIACHAGDYFLAKGCCASIRYFLGNVPICLIVDGRLSARRLQELQGVRVITRDSVADATLRGRSFGYGLTKMVAFWLSPWKHFLYLDADTVVWGNVLKFASFDRADMVVDRPRFDYSNDFISANFFDIDGVERHFPDFAWRDYRKYYFVTGAFFGTRGIFDIDEYREILDLMESEQQLFHYGEMGLLNFLICRAAAEGRLRLGQEHIQLIVPDFSQAALKSRFPIVRGVPIYRGEDVIIHWCGSKPTSVVTKPYADPMTFFRRRFVLDSTGAAGALAKVRLTLEDALYYSRRYLAQLRRALSKG